MIEMPIIPSVVAKPGKNIIKIVQGIPWDNKYKHVRLFNNQNELNAYIDSKTIYHTDDASVVRIGKAEVRLPVNEIFANNANYIAFQNSDLSDEWLYGFITSVDYLSPNSSRLNFELDIWTCSQFNMRLGKSFIERMHVPKNDDIPGKYTLPEEINIGDYICHDNNAIVVPPEPDKYEVVVAMSTDDNGYATEGAIYDGVYSSVQYQWFDLSDGDVSGVNALIADMTNKGYLDSIINVTMIPYGFTNDYVDLRNQTVNKPIATDMEYVPKNAKCLTYPYVMLEATNNLGQQVVYKYEYFTGDNAQFEYTINTDVQPILVMYPLNYMGIAKNYESAITYDAFPQCTIGVDAFKAWFAQNGSVGAVNRVSDVFSQQTGLPIKQSVREGISSLIAATKIAGSELNNPLGTIKNAIASFDKVLSKADGAKGVGGHNINTAIKSDRIMLYRKAIRPEYMRIVDDFFTLYGYQINKVDDINIKTRSVYNYIKTIGCTISGQIHTDMLSDLRAIFDNGVTVWHTNDIGNYDVDNN